MANKGGNGCQEVKSSMHICLLCEFVFPKLILQAINNLQSLFLDEDATWSKYRDVEQPRVYRLYEFVVCNPPCNS